MCGLPTDRLSSTHNARQASVGMTHSRLRQTGRVVMNHVIKHTGVGIICAVAYFDPYVFCSSIRVKLMPLPYSLPSGNWGVDLQAGSEFGYKLLFVVLLAGIFAVFLQVIYNRRFLRQMLSNSVVGSCFTSRMRHGPR